MNIYEIHDVYRAYFCEWEIWWKYIKNRVIFNIAMAKESHEL